MYRRRGRWCPWCESNARPLPYQGSALPLSHMGLTGAGEGNRTLILSLEGFCSTIELHPQVLTRNQKNGGGSRIRTYVGLSQQIYSLPPLATWVSHHK